MKRLQPPPRGVYEKAKGSGIWWIRYTDADGHRHREKVAAFGTAKKLLEKRHTVVLQGQKLPEHGRAWVTFDSLCDDALAHSGRRTAPSRAMSWRPESECCVRYSASDRPTR